MPNVRLMTALAVAVALTGCSDAREAARKPTLLIVDQIDEYQSLLETKVKAENAYYVEATKQLEKAATNYADLNFEAKTYERIDTFVDGVLNGGRAVSLSSLRALVNDLNTLQAQEFIRDDTRAAEFDKRRSNASAKVATKTKELAEAREAAMQIARPESSSDKAKRLFKFAKAASDGAKLDEILKSIAAEGN